MTDTPQVEHHARWLSDFKRVEQQRDKLAAELRETYPVLIAQLTDLFQRMDDYKTTDRLLRGALTALAVLTVVGLGAAVYIYTALQ